MDSNLLKRYFSNSYSRKEYQIVQDEFKKGADNSSLADAINQQWLELDENKHPDIQLNPLLDRLHHLINREGKKNPKKISLWQMAQRIAAILFLPLLLGSIFYNTLSDKRTQVNMAWAEIQCPLGVRTKFQLPDGSTGYLNSGSNLMYPIDFEHNRIATLQGEGFFDISHNEKSPFHLKTQNLDIRVLGTTFNVSAYADDLREEIVLQTGNIDISDTKGAKMVSLIPDQEFILNKKNSTFELNNVESEQFTSWKEGRLIFRNEHIEDMAIRLSRWYNAEVIVDKRNSKINSYTYHGTFIDEQLEDVLKLISITSPITYVQKERVRNEDGNYSRKKIILSINPKKIREFE
jgi:transmembrane sensor